jgi:CHAT domain-containing protein
LFALAELERRDGRLAEALAGLSAAEGKLAEIGDPDLLWQIHFSRGLTHKALGDKPAAIAALVAAVKLIEGVRSRLREKRFQAGYVQDKYEVYVELVELQLELGRTEDAFSTAERLRARSYTEQFGGRVSVALSEDDRHTETRLRERVRQLQRALTGEESQEQRAIRELAIATLSDELRLAEREYQTFLDDGANARPRWGLSDAIPTAASIQSRLTEGEALLEYVVGLDNLTVFVLTPRGAFAKTTPLRRADLAARIALLRDLTRRPGDDRWLKPAASLSAMLLEPMEVAGWLKGVRQLYVVPHGVLNYLPFSLLPQKGTGGQQLLIDKYTVAVLPTAAALLRDTRSPDVPQTLLAMAPGRSRLRYAPDEARSIDAFFRPHSQLLVGDGATESRFKAIAGRFGVLHLATHGYFNKLNPLLSGIELEADDADDGLLEVHEVLELHLVADLVTLSACETALGGGYFAEVPAGDEFVGMTRSFLAAGSASVLATLWEVDDRSSVRLMKRFYEQLGKPTQAGNKAGALARAQREFRSSGEQRHPYFWAPFILVGKAGQVGGYGV